MVSGSYLLEIQVSSIHTIYNVTQNRYFFGIDLVTMAFPGAQHCGVVPQQYATLNVNPLKKCYLRKQFYVVYSHENLTDTH